MLARLFEVRETANRGKGLFAKEHVPKGTVTFFECQRCRRISKDGFGQLPDKERNFVLEYGYAKADGSYLVPCDEIIYLNHSCNASILDSPRVRHSRQGHCQRRRGDVRLQALQRRHRAGVSVPVRRRFMLQNRQVHQSAVQRAGQFLGHARQFCHRKHEHGVPAAREILVLKAPAFGRKRRHA